MRLGTHEKVTSGMYVIEQFKKSVYIKSKVCESCKKSTIIVLIYSFFKTLSDIQGLFTMQDLKNKMAYLLIISITGYEEALWPKKIGDKSCQSNSDKRVSDFGVISIKLW